MTPLNYWRRIYSLFSSVKLALALLIIILTCCVIGVTVVRGERAGELIFGTIWFNGLLVLLVMNVGFCFFPRMWGRKMTIVLAGMILFHISFVAILGGIVYNSLYYFRGVIRLTEGEVLPSGDPKSYDSFVHGRLFDFAELKGETALITMHRGYRIGGDDKQAAYEVVLGEGSNRTTGVIYITHSLDHRGFSYFNDREGYSLLIILHDRSGEELYGAHVPLQSLKQKDGSYLYTTGTRDGPGSLPFPQEPLKPLFELQAAYIPSTLTGREREGKVYVRVWPQTGRTGEQTDEPLAKKEIALRERLSVKDQFLSVNEVRYWVVMTVRHEPGNPIVLTSLWVGLGGMVLTFMGRIAKSRG